MTVKFTNRATSLLASSINTSVTSLSVTASTGSKYPSLTAGDWFPVVVVAADGSYEIMRCTARAGDVLTVARAQEGTTALSFSAGARVDLRLTAAAIADIIATIGATDTTLQDLIDALSTLDFLVKTATGALSGERVVTDTATVAWDWATTGQGKASVVDASITYAKLQAATGAGLIGAGAAGPHSLITLAATLALSAGVLSAVQGAPGGVDNLSIKVASNTTVTVTADGASLFNGTDYKAFQSFNTTVNLGTTGAGALDASTIAIDTWYYIWLIGKTDGTKSAIASTSSTAPTMPSGYTFKRCVGEVRTIHASATLYGTWQIGRRVQYIAGLAQTTLIPNIANGAAGTFDTQDPVLATASVSSVVPPTAARIYGVATNKYHGSAASNVLVAPNTSWGGTGNGPLGSNNNGWPVYINGSVVNLGTTFDFLLEGTTIAWASGGAGGAISCLGWETKL